MNFKRLLYPMDGIEAPLSEHVWMHKFAVMVWAIFFGVAAFWALFFWVMLT